MIKKEFDKPSAWVYTHTVASELTTTPRKDFKMVYQLPTFKGYTVDSRLKEFRRIQKQGKHFAGMEYIGFDSDKGDRLLSAYIRTLDTSSEEFKRIAEAVI